MSADEKETERIAQAEKSRDEAWAAYRKAIGVPPSKHQRERLEQMAQAREATLEEVARLKAKIAGLEAMNTEKAAEIRRLRMGRHPAGRALRPLGEVVSLRDEIALREVLTERDAEHDGGEGA